MDEEEIKEGSLLGPAVMTLIPGVIGAVVLPAGPAVINELVWCGIAAIWWIKRSYFG
jgi:hypothetical protein